MSCLSARKQLKERIDALKAEGLKNINFYPGEVANALSEDFCAEANRLLDTVKCNKGKPLVFDDSQKK